MLHEHLTVKKICTHWITHNLSIDRKNAPKVRSRCFETCLWQVINRGFTRMSPKVNSSRLYGCFKMSQIQQKLLAHEALPSKWSPVIFGKTGHVAIVPLEQRRTVNSEWCSTTCLTVVFQVIRETNRRRRITLHHDNASSYTSTQTTASLSTQNIDLMSHPPCSPWHRMTSFYSRT